MKDKINFSQSELDVIEAGTCLAKRYMYEKENREMKGVFDKYASFSVGNTRSYEKENAIFHDSLVKETYERAGMNQEKVNLKLAFSFPHFERAFFSVIEEVIDKVNSKSELEDILMFAEIRNFAEGDSDLIEIKSKRNYFFSKVSNGRRQSHVQKYFGQEITLTPSPRQITIGFPIHQIAAGRFDYGREIARVSKGMRAGMLYEVAQLIFATADPLGNKFVENTWGEPAFRKLVQKVQIANDSTNTLAIGSKVALGNAKPGDSDYFKMGLGAEYMAKGYLTNIWGTPSLEIPNAALDILDIDNTLVVPNDALAIVSMDTERPIKIGMEGQTYIFQSTETENADRIREYTVETRYDVRMATQSHVGYIKTA